MLLSNCIERLVGKIVKLVSTTTEGFFSKTILGENFSVISPSVFNWMDGIFVVSTLSSFFKNSKTSVLPLSAVAVLTVLLLGWLLLLQ